jgi:hypothetical protein
VGKGAGAKSSTFTSGLHVIRKNNQLLPNFDRFLSLGKKVVEDKLPF